MRLLISFVFASALLGAGLYVLYLEAFVANIIMGKMILMGTGLAGIGAGWLWVDFISPLLRGKEMG